MEETYSINSTPIGEVGQVQVHFITNSPDIELPEEKRQLRVPTDARRYGLSQILNSQSMLDTTNPIPFDFLINGSFLRTTLAEYLTRNGLSSETTLDLQYVRSLIPPLYEASFEHDDWVSCVDVLSASSPAGSWKGASTGSIEAGQERVLSGSYDGLLRVWNKSGQTIGTSSSASAGGHTAGIKAAKFLSPTKVASAGLDRTVRVWKYTESEDHFSAELKPTLELLGHKGSIDSIAVHGASNRILTASADGTVGIWTTLKASAPAAAAALLSTGPIAKRRKMNGNSSSTTQRGPLSLIPLSAHATPVGSTGVIFDAADSTIAHTTSLDHTLRTLDLTTASVVSTRTTSHPLLSLCSIAGVSGSGNLLAAGTSARHITVLDPRVSASSTVAMTLRGHSNIVVDLCTDPDSPFGLVSASHDGTCRVWDLRSSRTGTRDEGGGAVSEPVYVIERESWKTRNAAHKGDDDEDELARLKKPAGGEGIKVFGVAWDRELGIVSAGEDRMVQVNRGRGVTKLDG